MKEWWEHDYETDLDTSLRLNEDQSQIPWTRTFKISVAAEHHERVFTDEEKEILRPICETLALIDGNPFFTGTYEGRKIWELYLSYAYSVVSSNGGFCGWASQFSWIQDAHHPNASVREAYQTLRTLKKLVPKD